MLYLESVQEMYEEVYVLTIAVLMAGNLFCPMHVPEATDRYGLKFFSCRKELISDSTGTVATRERSVMHKFANLKEGAVSSCAAEELPRGRNPGCLHRRIFVIQVSNDRRTRQVPPLPINTFSSHTSRSTQSIGCGGLVLQHFK